MMPLLFDIGFPGGSTGAAAAVGIFFLVAAMAYVVFRLLRKTVRLAFRMAIVATILLTFVVGAMALFYLGPGTGKPVRSEPTRRR